MYLSLDRIRIVDAPPYTYIKFRTNVSNIIFYLSPVPKVKTSLNTKMFHSNGSGGRGQVSAKKEGEIFSPKGKEIWKARPTGEGKSDSAGNQIVRKFCIMGKGMNMDGKPVYSVRTSMTTL